MPPKALPAKSAVCHAAFASRVKRRSVVNLDIFRHDHVDIGMGRYCESCKVCPSSIALAVTSAAVPFKRDFPTLRRSPFAGLH